MSTSIETLDLPSDRCRSLCELVREVHEECPGQTEFRYLGRLRSEPGPGAEELRRAFPADREEPLLVRGLPRFDDVERSKILTLVLGETVGRCVAYSDYNQSYITDIRPTTSSRERSAGVQLLDMHNDLAWASDACRPRVLVLVAHRARGVVPSTLLAPARAVLDALPDDVVSVLRRPAFEARAGSTLNWGHERVRRMAMVDQVDGRPVVRLNFGAFGPAASLSDRERAEAAHALAGLHQAALAVGRDRGHAIQEGEALLIPNDHCVHGREPIDDPHCERMLLRSYVVPDEVARRHGRTMIPLSA